MKYSGRIAILGGGSWATAMVNILQNKNYNLNWFLRNKKNINYIKTNNHNPNYLSSLKINSNKIHFFYNLGKAIQNSDILIFAIPAAFLRDSLSNNQTLDSKHS